MAIQDRMTRKFDVAVAGEIFIDHVFSGFPQWPTPGQEYFTENYVREAGGGAAITACALARLGRSVQIFGVVGSEEVWLRDRLRSFGVGLDSLRTVSSGTAVSVSISTREDRSFLTWPGANQCLPDYLRDPETQGRLCQSRHVHLAFPITRELAAALFPILRAAGCTLSLDLGHQPEWLRDKVNWKTCGEVDFFLPNQVEGQIMTGAQKPEGVLSAMNSMGITAAVLKLGGEGAAWLDHAGVYRAGPPPVEAVDSTGAGDAFDAGFIDALLDRASPSETLQRACICGALSTRKAGALAALPDQQELNHFYAQSR